MFEGFAVFKHFKLFQMMTVMMECGKLFACAAFPAIHK
jgi:hypothetical protein